MRLVVAAAAADAAAAFILAQLSGRERFDIALSGGKSPWAMVERLFAAAFDASFDTTRLHVWQVDERVAPAGHEDRNWTELRPRIPQGVHLHPIPVDAAADPTGLAAAEAYRREVAGRVFDVVHLGLGDDGHTASLFPGDPALHVRDRDVVATGPRLGWPRVTLTYPVLRRAAAVVFLVTGAGKKERLKQLLAGDRTIPAGQLGDHPAVTIFADPAAAG